MRSFPLPARVLALLCAALLTGCADKPPPPPPDGSSGIRGVALLPADPPDADGKVPDRQRWAGVGIHVSHTNHSSNDPTWNLRYKTTADGNGLFEIALNPGDYLVYPHDPVLLKDMAITGDHVKVEPGKFVEIVVDYDKIRMHKVELKRP